MSFIDTSTSVAKLIGSDTTIKSTLGWKGERGYSAYEIAVQNGYTGTVEEWLATLGTSSFFEENKTMYVTTTANETTLDLPSIYNAENTFIDIYISGIRLNTNAYTINTSTQKINLTNPIVLTNTEVEIVCLKMSTNNLPIVTTISSGSTNDTVTTSKAVYDFIMSKVNDTTPSTISAYSSNKTQELIDTLETSVHEDISGLERDIGFLDDTVNTLGNNMAAKFDSANIKILTGSIPNIGANETKTTDISYPSGFSKDNTVIISKMSSSNSVYYDTLNLEATASGFPVIQTIALMDTGIRVWLKNTNNSTARIGYFKITIMKG